SPYLLQHAHNPVDWYPWGEEAFARARAEDKPILLSVGYSACHWCHVMERESFENEAIAAQMNRDFINIKVDREERPDVDAIYMGAVQMLTQQGGWPMTVFLTPDGKPFYGGTYFPPEDRWGRPGFPRLLEAIANAWQTQRADVEQQSEAITAQLNEASDFSRGLPDALLTPTILQNAFETLSRQFDSHYGGFGSAPKFPQPANLDFLLRFYAYSQRQEPLAMVEKTLQQMALGGIYDQLGGGFHRYSTDAVWLVPHFEKMLYDNAQLAQTYTRCFQATGKAFYRGVAEETLEYVLREMTSPEGGFYSAQDADSEGEEGKFFVWTPEEVEAVLDAREAEVFCAFYDVTPHGNWEGRSILHVVMDVPEVAARFGLSIEEAARILDGGREKLFAAREHRVKPGLDDKILAAWNGLMLAAFAEAAAVFDNDAFRQAAERNAGFVLSQMSFTDAQGRFRLYRTYRNGEAKLNGYLEDYAFTADGLLWLYEATFDARWLDTARALTETMLAYFWDEDGGGFFATSSDHETLIQRLKDWDDNATPSGNSVAVEVLLKLAVLTGEDSYRQKAARVLRKLGPVLEKHPYGFARMLGALDFYLSTPKEIALVGDPAEEATKALLRAVYASYLPNKVVALAARPEAALANIPLLADRPMREGRPTAYVCENFACKEPVTTPERLTAQLRS
ncbi:MAG TPA: thioredoxin domain-containing protein, partial [Chthonomonadaceae bacterium]|nr:thioredoxin domain-containing protein [Chthonomonadaceae bacterium]